MYPRGQLQETHDQWPGHGAPVCPGSRVMRLSPEPELTLGPGSGLRSEDSQGRTAHGQPWPLLPPLAGPGQAQVHSSHGHPENLINKVQP